MLLRDFQCLACLAVLAGVVKIASLDQISDADLEATSLERLDAEAGQASGVGIGLLGLCGSVG